MTAIGGQVEHGARVSSLQENLSRKGPIPRLGGDESRTRFFAELDSQRREPVSASDFPHSLGGHRPRTPRQEARMKAFSNVTLALSLSVAAILAVSAGGCFDRRELRSRGSNCARVEFTGEHGRLD